jgi:alpha-ketoglutarate-dependent taurine dioxygenase
MQVRQITLEGQQNYDSAGGVFPLIYNARVASASDPSHSANQSADKVESAKRWIAENRESLIQALAQHGAVLFRGFGVRTDLEFDELIGAFELPNFTYQESLSNAVRRNRTERVFTANEAPPSVSIFLHHEMAQTPVYPSKLFFFCEHADMTGGATPLCRSDVLLARLLEVRPHFVAACERLGVRYSNTMPYEDDLASGQGRSWRSTLSVADAAAAEEKLTGLGYSWQWQEDGQNLRVTTPCLPAVRALEDGRKVFFNQLIAAFRGWKDARNSAEKSISFGDGSMIDSADMAVAIALADELCFDIQWQAGDFALVDNFLVMHGRRPFEGERRVLASLVG